jgi:hypothetical protein
MRALRKSNNQRLRYRQLTQYETGLVLWAALDRFRNGLAEIDGFGFATDVGRVRTFN